MSYLPLARKYRPQTFDELIGQPHVTATLTRSLQTKRLGQAYLFTGQRGVGKTSAARILAKCLNCAKGPTATPCNECSSCTQITQGNSLDVIEIDGASNRGIDEVRSLRETVPYAPTSGQFRVYIIDEVHMLTTEAFNALLKTLEEPPAHVKFIFATTAANKVPPTILSRCQRFDFRRLEAATIVGLLTRVAKAEQVDADQAALYAIARASEGSVRDAEVVLEQLASFVKGAISEADVSALLGAVTAEALLTLTQAILAREVSQALTILMGQLEQGKDAPQLMAALVQCLRDLLIISSTKDAPDRETILTRLVDEPADRLRELERVAGRSTPQELLLLLQAVTGAYELIRRSPMAHTVLELVVIKLATRDQWQSLEQISKRLEQLGAGPSTPSATIRSTSPHAVRTANERHPAQASLTPSAASSASEAVLAATPMSAPEEALSVWPEFLQRLGTQKMSLAAYLAEAKPIHFEHGMLTVGLPAVALHQEVLNTADNRRLVDRLLAELCHTKVTVQYATLPEPVSSQEASASAPSTAQPPPPIVQDIVNLFNATILDQPRTSP